MLRQTARDLKQRLDTLLTEVESIQEALAKVNDLGANGKPYPKVGTQKYETFKALDNPNRDLTQDIVLLLLRKGFPRGSIINNYIDWLEYHGIVDTDVTSIDYDHEKQIARN